MQNRMNWLLTEGNFRRLNLCSFAGDNNLMRILYETGEDNDVITAESLQHTAAPWKFRTPITVDHFFRQFQHKVQDPQTPSDALPLLRLFHAEVMNENSLESS